MKKEIHRKKVVNVNDRANQAKKPLVKVPNNLPTKKKYKIDWKKEIPAIILLILFVFWSIGSVFGFIGYKRTKADTIVTSADSFSDENLNHMDFRYANYFNPFSTPYNGVAYVTNSTWNSVELSASSLSFGYISVNYDISAFFEVGDRIYVKGVWDFQGEGNGAIRVQWIEPNATSSGVIGSLTTSNANLAIDSVIGNAPTSTARLCLSLYYTYSVVVGKPRTITYSSVMCSKNTSYFIPNLEAIYEQGKLVSMEKYDLGYMNGATFSGTFTRAANDFASSFDDIPVQHNGKEIFFTNLYNELKKQGALDTSTVTLSIKFGSAVYGENLKLIANGNKSSFYYDADTPQTFTIKDTDGARYTGRWYYEESLENYGLQGYNAPLNVYYNGIERWGIGVLSDLKALKLSVPDTSYSVGFNDGYNLGLRDNKDLSKFYKDGYNSGYVLGYNKGKNDGIEMTHTYTFDRLLSAVFDVPIKAFMGLTNFEVLGVNLSGFYLSLLTACAVLVVVKLLI